MAAGSGTGAYIKWPGVPSSIRSLSLQALVGPEEQLAQARTLGPKAKMAMATGPGEVAPLKLPRRP